MEFKHQIRDLLFRAPALYGIWSAYRRWQLHREYDLRREHYSAAASAMNLRYSEMNTIASVRDRMKGRGYSPGKRASGNIHTFAFVPNIGWHRHLIPDLQELGHVTVFDYTAHGYRWDEFNQSAERRNAMNDLVLPALRKAHAQRPVDWVFVYASGMEILARTVRRISEEMGIPTVNMCLDDKQSWACQRVGEQRIGQIDIASCFDLSWTSARVACEWYLVEGGRPFYLPEGFNVHAYVPMKVPQDLPVSFIGGAYGFRPSVAKYLKAHKVPIQLLGPGWGTREVWEKEQVEIVNRSIINLGMGGIGYSESLTNVKTRDFEIPGTGGGVYLTSYNDDLAQHFVEGEEILFYRSREEMLELIRFYLARPEAARTIAVRARSRCLREHRWLHRYQKILSILGISDDETPANSAMTLPDLRDAQQKH